MDDLWRGGDWERPSPQVEPIPILSVPRSGPDRARKRRRRRWILFCATLALILGLTAVLAAVRFAGLGPGRAAGRLDPVSEFVYAESGLPRAPTGADVSVTLAPPEREALDYVQVYEKNERSIVTVNAFDRYGMSQGTGIVLTEDGYIVTNAHVVEGAGSAMVLLGDDSRYEASLVGENVGEDLAVLKIGAEGLVPAQFGDSDLLRVGDQVSALGNPMGYRLSLTPGIISALDRELYVEGSAMYLLQTSAPINYGNSGGALLNDRGQVVGITTVKIVDDEGSAEALGFAIPSTRVKYVVDRLIAGREIKTPMLGVTVRQDREAGGLRVEEIQPWSGAVDRLERGDVIVAANGRPVTVYRDLSRVKDLMDVGDSLELTVARDGREFTVEVLLSESREPGHSEPVGR